MSLIVSKSTCDIALNGMRDKNEGSDTNYSLKLMGVDP